MKKIAESVKWCDQLQCRDRHCPPEVSFMMLHLTCCSNEVVLGTFLNTSSYPNFSELNGSYMLGHSWKFTFLDIEYLLNSCPSSIVKWVQCCFVSWKIKKWKYYWIGGSFVQWLFLHNLWFLMSFYSSIKSVMTVLIFHCVFAFGAQSYKVVVVLSWDFELYLMLSLKSDFRRSYMIRGTIFQLIC